MTPMPTPDAPPSKIWPFVKGALLPPPVFCGMGVTGVLSLNSTGDAPFILFLMLFLGAVVGFGWLIVLRWSSARPFAVGVLVSSLFWGVLLALFGVVVVAAAAAGSRG
jgi:hypothetical protein